MATEKTRAREPTGDPGHLLYASGCEERVPFQANCRCRPGSRFTLVRAERPIPEFLPEPCDHRALCLSNPLIFEAEHFLSY